MATTSRGALIAKTLKISKRHFKPVIPPKKRSLLEHLLFACVLENSPHDAAERVFTTLSEDYYDWNEVRVSTVRELSEVMKPLVDPFESAARLKKTLQSVFESIYDFDLESLKKENIGQAVKKLERYNGTTPFTLAYVTQTALSGHSIPVNRGLLLAMHVVGVVSDAEARKGVVPGLERAVSKNKGIELGSLLHQLGVEVGRNPYGPNARKLLLEINAACKDRLPKRPSKTATDGGPEEPEKEAKPERPAVARGAKRSDGKPVTKIKTRAKAAKRPAKKKTSARKKAAGQKKAAKSPARPRKKTAAKKKLKTKKKKKTTSRRLSKKKPR